MEGLGKQIFDTPETSRRNLEKAKANWREKSDGLGLQRPQKIQQVLSLRVRERVEPANHLDGFRPVAGVRLDRFQQVGRASIVQEENALADAPQRRAAELIRACVPLRDAIVKTLAHVMQHQIREQIHLRIRHAVRNG